MTMPAADLRISESETLHLLESDAGDGYFNADGSVNMVLIRPCNGLGPGSRIYEADMLARDAHVFTGMAMFDNHDSQQAKTARGHLPRSPTEIGGGVLEAWWEPNFQTPQDAAKGFGKGAVLGKCMLLPVMETLVRKLPHLLKTSVNASATGLKPGSRNGKKGQIVEGILRDATSSVDLVTAAGAGGEVAPLLEAFVPDGHTPESGCNDPSHGNSGNATTGAEVNADEVNGLITEAMKPVLAALAGLTPEKIGATITEAATAAAESQRETLQAELSAELSAPTVIRGLADHAAQLIESTKLPVGPAADAARAKLLADFGAIGTGANIKPGPRLSLIEAEYNADGTEKTSVDTVLEAAIKAEADTLRDMLGAARPSVPLTVGLPSAAPSGAPAAISEAAIPKPQWMILAEKRGLGTDHLIEAPAAAPAAATA